MRVLTTKRLQGLWLEIRILRARQKNRRKMIKVQIKIQKSMRPLKILRRVITHTSQRKNNNDSH